MSAYNFIDLTRQRFGRLTVLERAENNKHNNARYICKCDCGTEIIARSCDLKSGNTQSCGCLQKERTSEASKTHGLTGLITVATTSRAM